jgi:leader peptidase (prepilin peptidase)/N-methyltransferase
MIIPDVVFAFLLGAVVGSFLNVCIYRLPRRESIVWPGSRCPSCGTAIHWYDNVPLLGYLVLGGQCRSCRSAIGIRYPIVEAVTAVMFLATYWTFGWQPLLAVRLAFGCALLVLFAIDLEHQILPNAITLPGIVVGFACSLFLPPGWRSSLLGLVIGGGSLWILAEAWLRLRKVEALGFGDVKMMAMVGAFLGWPQVILTLVLSSFAGSLVGVALILSGRGSMSSKLPYGTFIALAALAASLVGEPLIAWYLSVLFR